jgi:GTP-binding protein Era
VNKADSVTDKARLLPLIADLAALRDFAAIIPVSAEKHWVLDHLTAEITKLLPLGPPLYPADDLTDRDERFLAAEFIREKIFRRLGKEVPYATTVAIDDFVQDGGLRRIQARVLVDKASQRAILLGEGGERMKEIASAARRDMERLFGGKVFLEVRVRVESGWAGDERELDRLGY